MNGHNWEKDPNDRGGASRSPGASSPSPADGAGANHEDGAGTSQIVVPDYARPLVGWRAWRVCTAPICLLSFNYVYWPPRKPSQAVCVACYPPGSGHLAPDQDCECGIYAWKRAPRKPDPGFAYGRVGLWGLVVEHEFGYRAQFAYPLEVWLPTIYWGLADTLSESYGIPVHKSRFVSIQEAWLWTTLWGGVPVFPWSGVS
jgi:hypothetical protein